MRVGITLFHELRNFLGHRLNLQDLVKGLLHSLQVIQIGCACTYQTIIVFLWSTDVMACSNYSKVLLDSLFSTFNMELFDLNLFDNQSEISTFRSPVPVWII